MKNKLSLTEDFLPGEEEARDLFDVPEGPDPETLEGQGWEYVASKDVYDENGFRDVYYWYKKDGNNRFFFSSDVDCGDPEYFDWETDGEEAAQEWFDSYGEDEDEITLVDNREAAILGKGDDPGFDEYDKVDEAIEDKVTEKAEIETPRGDFCVYKGTWKDFENEPDRDDWGFWFDHYTDENKHFKIMHNHIDNSAIAVLKEELKEDTVKQNGKWVNKGKEGTHGKFKNKKEADAQRKAMFAQGFKESLTEDPNQPTDTTVAGRLITAINDEWKTIDLYNNIISELSNTDGDDYKKMIPIIEDIVNEENVHVGQLQKALELISPDTVDIAKGEKEAEEQISGGDPADDKKALVDESYNKTVKESLDDDDIDIDTESERWEDIYEYGDDADEYDDFELAGIYGGDLTYCPICGRRLQYDEGGDSFCPKCEKSAWDLAQERRKRDKSESVDSSDDLSDEEMNEACGSNIETEENLDECDYNNLEDDPAVDVSDLRAPVDPHEKEKLQEFGPAAAAIVSAVAPVVADKVLDKILPENAPAATVDETEVQGAGEEDDIDESVLNTL